MPVLHDPHDAVCEAFAKPINSAPLTELARNVRSAAIAICDVTRPVPNRLLLRPLIETWARAGVPLKRIIVLIATGLHRPNLGAELEELIGDAWVLQNVQIENHYARNDDEHVLLGRTGGRLIVASECSEGLGSAEFVESQRRLLRLGPEAFLRLGHVSNPHPSEESTSPGTGGGRTWL